MTNNPSNRQQWIFDLLKVEVLNYVEMWAKYGQKWAKGKTTFDKDWNKANERYTSYRKKADKAKDDVSIANEVSGLKLGLKSKNEKIAHLQNEVDFIDNQLNGKVKFTFVVASKIMKSHTGDEFNLPVQIQNDLRKRKLEYITEINKMQGDYANTKLEVTGKDGKAIKTETEFNITLNVE